MVRAGLGITLMPRTAARPTDDRIRDIPFAPTAPSRVTGLAWRNTSACALLFAELSKLALQAAGRS